MNTFSEIFKKSFITNVESMSFEKFILAMLMAFICGIIIYCVYRGFYKGVIYNNNFNILLVMTTVVTCFIVIVISSNVVLSLGMVGALSIVRFRSAIKDPLDVGFLFWAVAAGITSGAGLYVISISGTVFVALVYIIMVFVRSQKRVYLLVLKYDNKAGIQVREALKHTNKVLKNRTASLNETEMTYEIKLSGDNTTFVNELSQIEGVHNAVLVDFTGDYCQ